MEIPYEASSMCCSCIRRWCVNSNRYCILATRWWYMNVGGSSAAHVAVHAGRCEGILQRHEREKFEKNFLKIGKLFSVFAMCFLDIRSSA